MRQTSGDQDKFVGLWVTADGVIRHRLLPGDAMTKHEVRVRVRTRATIGCRTIISNTTTTPALPPTGIFAKACFITQGWSCIARRGEARGDTGWRGNESPPHRFY